MNYSYEEELERNVKRGSEWLDRNYPGWYRKENIDLELLEMANGNACVIGQLPYFHSQVQYSRKIKAAKLSTKETENLLTTQFESDYGFNLIRHPIGHTHGMEVLTKLWEHEIQSRRLLDQEGRDDKTPQFHGSHANSNSGQ